LAIGTWLCPGEWLRHVLLVERLRAAIAKLNPTLNAETRVEVLAKLTQTATPSLVEENRRLHRYMIEGVPVEVRRADGSISGEQARLIDFDDPDANDWLAVKGEPPARRGDLRQRYAARCGRIEEPR
jgi:type I site-specific restriction-modification system R (restriction) subunit